MSLTPLFSYHPLKTQARMMEYTISFPACPC